MTRLRWRIATRLTHLARSESLEQRQAHLSPHPAIYPAYTLVEQNGMVADDGDNSHHVTKAEPSRTMDASEQRAQRRVAQNESLDASRTEMNRQKSIDSLKRFSYLLGQTEPVSYTHLTLPTKRIV